MLWSPNWTFMDARFQATTEVRTPLADPMLVRPPQEYYEVLWYELIIRTSYFSTDSLSDWYYIPVPRCTASPEQQLACFHPLHFHRTDWWHLWKVKLNKLTQAYSASQLVRHRSRAVPCTHQNWTWAQFTTLSPLDTKYKKATLLPERACWGRAKHVS